MTDVGVEQRIDLERGRRRDRLIGVYIGVLAVGLAVCTLGGGNATKNATLKNLEASNTWAFFQAKNLRRQMVRLRAEEVEMQLTMDPPPPEATRSLLTERLKSYRDQEQKLTTEPEKGEGLDELYKRGKALEAERDRAMRQDPYFDYGQAMLQIAIVLASVAILAGGSFLLWISGALGLLGAFLTFNGFTLFLTVPFIG